MWRFYQTGASFVGKHQLRLVELYALIANKRLQGVRQLEWPSARRQSDFPEDGRAADLEFEG